MMMISSGADQITSSSDVEWSKFGIVGAALALAVAPGENDDQHQHRNDDQQHQAGGDVDDVALLPGDVAGRIEHRALAGAHSRQAAATRISVPGTSRPEMELLQHCAALYKADAVPTLDILSDFAKQMLCGKKARRSCVDAPERVTRVAAPAGDDCSMTAPRVRVQFDAARARRADRQRASRHRSRPARSQSASSSAAPASSSTSSSTRSPRCWSSRRWSSRYVDPLTGTLYSFALFSLAFVGRPFGTLDLHRARPEAWPRREADHRAVPARRLDDGDRLAAELRAGRRRSASGCSASSAFARASRLAAPGTACRRCCR